MSAEHMRLTSGLRWTLWLSVVTAPCGYATTILLARISPEAIGEYGLLSLYLSLTSVFVFLGGPAVVIRFVPALPEERRVSFLWLYLVVACIAALPFQLIAAVTPGTLRYVFGDVSTPRFQVLLVWLADVYILFNLAIAALKAFMELRLAQVLVRTVTVGSFVVYAVLCLWFPRVMAAHYHAVLWSVYFAFTAIITAAAVQRIIALAPPSAGGWLGRFPDGFWQYTLGLQASSVLGFLSTKLDYLFILNAGGLATLGRYVALMTLLSIVPMFATFVLDSYLPSLTTLLSAGDTTRLEHLTRTYVRLILLLGCGSLAFMSVFAGPLVRMLGPRYSEMAAVVQMALPFTGVQIANWIIGTIFSGVGRPQRDAIAKAFRTVLFVAAFWPLWNAAHFVGAVWAWGIGEVGYQALSVYLLRSVVGFRLSLYGGYIPMVALAIVLQFAAGWSGGLTTAGALALWCGSMVSFLVVAQYSLSEITILWRALMPGSRAADSDTFASRARLTQTT